MVYRLVYRYDVIFHGRNFLVIIKILFRIIKTLVKVNAKNILKCVCMLHVHIVNPRGVKKII